MTSRKVTMADIARESGASPTTVSLVLRDKPGIGSETRDRVLEVARNLGYEHRVRGADQGARAGRPLAIAVVFRVRARTDEDREFALNPFYSWVLSGIEAEARNADMNLLFGSLAVDSGNRTLDAPRRLLEQHLDGLIIVGALEASRVADLLDGRKLPVVQVDGPATPGPYDSVASDNAGGMREITEYLIGQGHERIVLITRVAGDNPNFTDRERGYAEAMVAAGLEPQLSRTTYGEPTQSVHAAFDADPHLTALLGVNDQFAIEAVRVTQARGLTIPRDVSIGGFDNIELSSAITPPLTTMRVDKVGMGRRAVGALVYRRQWPDAAPACVVISPRLIVRGSTGPCLTSASSRQSALASDTRTGAQPS